MSYNWGIFLARGRTRTQYSTVCRRPNRPRASHWSDPANVTTQSATIQQPGQLTKCARVSYERIMTVQRTHRMEPLRSASSARCVACAVDLVAVGKSHVAHEPLFRWSLWPSCIWGAGVSASRSSPGGRREHRFGSTVSGGNRVRTAASKAKRSTVDSQLLPQRLISGRRSARTARLWGSLRWVLRQAMPPWIINVLRRRKSQENRYL